MEQNKMNEINGGAQEENALAGQEKKSLPMIALRGKVVFLSRTAYHRVQGYSRIHTNDTLPFNLIRKAAAQTGGRSTIFHYGRPTRKPEPSRHSGDHAAARQLHQLACAVIDAVLHDLGEAFTGDIPAFVKTDGDREVEAGEMERWCDRLPPPHGEELRALFREIEALDTL